VSSNPRGTSIGKERIYFQENVSGNFCIVRLDGFLPRHQRISKMRQTKNQKGKKKKKRKKDYKLRKREIKREALCTWKA
jgi:hypothetical protein